MSRVVARRTTDLLAIAILIVGGLMVVGRLSEWWSTEPEPVGQAVRNAAAEAGSPGDWGLHGAPVVLEFGDFPQALRRQTVRATEPQAAQQLTAWCRDTVAHSDPPAAAATDQERRLLAQLEKLAPVETVDERGAVYRVDVPLLMALGVRTDGRKSEPETTTDAAGRPARVVCWGFAFPQQKDVWTFFLSSEQSVERSRAPIPEIPLPEGSRRVLAFRSEAGDGLVGFEGHGKLQSWQAAFDAWSLERGWLRVRPWTDADGGTSARFATPRSDVPQAGWQGTVDVLLRGGPRDSLSGMFNFVPATTR